MPVARIYTRFPHETPELAARLRARGYTVEVVDPGDFHVTPADLEVHLDRLPAREAFARAARYAREHDAAVHVGPGLPVAHHLDTIAAAQAERGNVFADAARALRRGFGSAVGMFRHWGAQLHEARAARRGRALEVEAEREAQRGAAERQKREAETRAAEERARHQEEESRRREETERRARGEEQRRAAMIEEEQRRQALERRRREEEEATRERELAAKLAEQRQLALREREEERRRAAEAAALEQARRRTRAAIPDTRYRPAAYLPRERESRRVWKRSLVTAAALALLAMIGWAAYANRTPAAPLTNTDLVRGQQIEQEVPFGPATIQGAQAAATPHPPRPAHRAERQPTSEKPQPAARREPRQHRYADDEVDIIAEDEVIYHGAPKRSNAHATRRDADGVKRISDEED